MTLLNATTVSTVYEWFLYFNWRIPMSHLSFCQIKFHWQRSPARWSSLTCSSCLQFTEHLKFTRVLHWLQRKTREKDPLSLCSFKTTHKLAKQLIKRKSTPRAPRPWGTVCEKKTLWSKFSPINNFTARHHHPAAALPSQPTVKRSSWNELFIVSTYGVSQSVSQPSYQPTNEPASGEEECSFLSECPFYGLWTWQEAEAAFRSPAAATAL